MTRPKHRNKAKRKRRIANPNIDYDYLDPANTDNDDSYINLSRLSFEERLSLRPRPGGSLHLIPRPGDNIGRRRSMLDRYAQDINPDYGNDFDGLDTAQDYDEVWGNAFNGEWGPEDNPF